MAFKSEKKQSPRERGIVSKEILALRDRVEVIKKAIAVERDKLRAVLAELEELQTDCDEAVESLDVGKSQLESAADQISKYL